MEWTEAPGVLNHAEEAYLRIRELLLSGDHPPGTQMSERQLSDELNMSRTPVREALKRLQRDGLVTAGGRGSGVVVCGLSVAEVRHAYEYRAALESLTAELAAVRSRDGELSRAQLAELDARAKKVEEHSRQGDQRRATVANLRFHQWICTLAANPFATEALTRLWDRIAISSLSNLTADAEWSHEVHRHHRDIVAAVTDGDPALAAEVARHHIRRAAVVYSGSQTREEEF
ncbi:GntR family transcriptional regulator [Streptosporangium sp. NPDC051023]|uniref:GntR family transcriptional regulator n=1 Tax=Streptosporangium sp. NPDC051023 TaxID=3155410 RepID=UPI0034509210